MRAPRIKRGAALALATAALTATAVAGAGSASASSGGGCGGPTYKNVCISDHGDGAIGSDAYLNFGNVNPNCYLQQGVFDKTTRQFPVWQTVSCKNGYQHLGNALSNPASGHEYAAFVHIHWDGGDGYEAQDSPVLTY
ncbi:hypothetical protein AB0H17_23790 [Streptomyces olivoreticuli]